uniref:Solute carrier family 35 member F5 n=1 Tax=Culicoides sonorensis TaxID=179676 RepID=A0A336MFB4_CULSO
MGTNVAVINNVMQVSKMLNNKTQRLILGVILLLLVDVIWVSSSELTKFLYENEQYNKPFFCTYFKTSMFTLYLVGLGVIAPWKTSCMKSGSYTLVEQNDDDEPAGMVHSPSSLSDATFVPIKTPEPVSGTESDDSSVRSVRFNKLAEVREMSPHEASDALMSRLSYSASIRFRRQKTHHKTARTALMFCILWFIANYMFQLALEPADTSLITLLSTTSSFFTILLASIFPSLSGDKFTLSKFVAVMMSCGGATMVTLSEINDPKMSKGIILAVLSAFFYSAYLVLVKHKNDTEEKIDLPLFFGFVGICNVFLMWPLFFVLNFSRIEVFEWPNQKQFAVLFLNGLVGTVFSEALWLWGCLLTSSLVGTLAVSLQIPLAMLFDLILHNKQYPPLFYIGSIPMFLALIFVAFLVKYDDSDPLLRFFKIIYRKLWICRKSHVIRISEMDAEQNESLINDDDDDNHES